MALLSMTAAVLQPSPASTEAGVDGIGGVFFKVEDPASFKAWYRDHLGIDAGDHGANFFWKPVDAEKYARTVWSPFSRETSYFGNSDQQLMINYRVWDLDRLLAELEEKGVDRIGEIESYPYGRFAWIHDVEGNRVELWEPVDLSPAEYREQFGGTDKQ